ncbi:MAG: hypothetical protein GWN00_29005 [Aliifodinibius sp.]|nr:O-antigen ligase family protein [Fodinibius sp.]NIV14813.1 hypothetical protein [Fodinibius sp.]NIY28692.1 hypothetical protein [Fodinibius sp.]
MLVMILVVLTETDPVEAIKTMVRRCAYVLVPLSVVFIKYYPALGRSYSRWTGEAYYMGVTTHKNYLGALCLVCGIFFLWSLLTLWRKKSTSVDKKEVFINVLFLFMISWLFIKADSATSLLCFIVGICILIWTGLPIKKNVKVFSSYVLFLGLVFLILNFSFEIMQALASSLGRDMTLTGRVDFWKELIAMDINPLLGTGYESFWLGERAEEFWGIYYWHPNQAHNGYLETYLNLGWIGLFLLIGIIISASRKSSRTFMFDYDYGKFQMAFLAIVLLYNVTEAAFHGLHLMHFFFLLIAMDFFGAYRNFRFKDQ